MQRRRVPEIDICKGILTVTMILCHSIQFFGREENLIQGLLVNIINLTTFSGFLFCFGYAAACSYYQRSWRESAVRMGKNALRMLAAFYISGIAYVALAEQKIFNKKLIAEILLLCRYPGWSEFLASFAAILVVGIILFPLFQHMNDKLFAGIAVVSAAACFLPYDRIHNPHLALFVGSGDYVTFPAVQYGVFFAFGIWMAKKQLAWNRVIFLAVLLASMPCLYIYASTGTLPMRFPPSIWFVGGGFLFVYLYYLLSCWLAGMQKQWIKPVVRYLESVGRDSLCYLLLSNIFIFAVDGSKFSFRSIAYAYIFFIVLLLILQYFKKIQYTAKVRE